MQKDEKTAPGNGDILYEPDGDTVLDTIVPEYLGGVLYGALCESRASEQAARRSAMDSATQNAEEMIGDLTLNYNRARQAAITQELVEIVSGASASAVSVGLAATYDWNLLILHLLLFSLLL